MESDGVEGQFAVDEQLADSSLEFEEGFTGVIRSLEPGIVRLKKSSLGEEGDTFCTVEDIVPYRSLESCSFFTVAGPGGEGNVSEGDALAELVAGGITQKSSEDSREPPPVVSAACGGGLCPAYSEASLGVPFCDFRNISANWYSRNSR